MEHILSVRRCRNAALASVPSGPQAVIGCFGLSCVEEHREARCTLGNNRQVAVIDATGSVCSRVVSSVIMIRLPEVFLLCHLSYDLYLALAHMVLSCIVVTEN